MWNPSPQAHTFKSYNNVIRYIIFINGACSIYTIVLTYAFILCTPYKCEFNYPFVLIKTKEKLYYLFYTIVNKTLIQGNKNGFLPFLLKYLYMLPDIKLSDLILKKNGILFYTKGYWGTLRHSLALKSWGEACG